WGTRCSPAMWSSWTWPRITMSTPSKAGPIRLATRGVSNATRMSPPVTITWLPSGYLPVFSPKNTVTGPNSALASLLMECGGLQGRPRPGRGWLGRQPAILASVPAGRAGPAAGGWRPELPLPGQWLGGSRGRIDPLEAGERAILADLVPGVDRP